MINCKILLHIFMMYVLLLNPADLYCRESPPPLLLSLDVELDSDVQALEQLSITVPATYFVTGKFARNYPEVTDKLAQSGTIGSHSHSHPDLTELSLEEVRRDLAASAEAIKTATGHAPVWFRAPFLEINEKVLSVARDLGFRHDSSEPERWVQQQVLSEFPISINDTGRVLFSDYDFFSGYGLDDMMALDMLKENYLSRFETGRPFVFLLHPSIIVEHSNVLHQFIHFVQEQGGSCLSFDQYFEQIHAASAENMIGVRIDLSRGRLDLKQTLDDLVKAQVTDVFISSRDKTGRIYYSKEEIKAGSIEEHFSQLVYGLHDAGIRVHGWIPVLHDTTSASKFPDQAMVDGSGQPSKSWVSPSHPQTINNITLIVSDLLIYFPISGIHLDELAYPDLNFDYSLEALNKFKLDTTILFDNTAAASVLPAQYYNEWITWRAAQLSGIVESVASVISRADRDILLSAALKAGSLIDFRAMELSGQDSRMLAKYLDMIVAVSLSGSSAEKTGALPRLISMSRFKIGDRSLLVGLPVQQETAVAESTIDQLGRQLSLVRQGANGFLLSPYRDIFEHSKDGSRRPDEINTLINTFRQPIKKDPQPVVPVPVSLVTEAHATPSSPAPQLIINKEVTSSNGNINGPQVLSVVCGLTLLLFLGFRFIRSRRFYKAPEPVKKSTDIFNWKHLDKDIRDNQISGQLVHAVASHLRRYDPVSTNKYRITFVIDMVAGASQQLSLNDLISMAVDIPGWQILAMSHLQEAVTLGYIDIEHDRIKVTEKGTEELRLMKADGFNPAHWIFVEQRLHESLNVSCPDCDANNLTHWYWANFTCSTCSQEVTLWDCSDISRRNPAIIGLNQHYYR